MTDDSPRKTDLRCKTCENLLRVYQPHGHYPTIYCGECQSPWGLHCRPIKPEDIETAGEDLLDLTEGDV
jgi:hypothetical protein